MASSSSNNTGETGGRRRSQRGADDTSKKKQKDRANQESREAKRAAAGAMNTEIKKGEQTLSSDVVASLICEFIRMHRKLLLQFCGDYLSSFQDDLNR